MKERGILFSSEMVRAILAGTKTQTRRRVAKQERFGPGWSWPKNPVRCPYGVVGDRLWVRETWSIANGNGRRIVFRADQGTDRWPPTVDDPGTRKVWKPGIHLRRVDARITLDVLSVRVERLHDISEEDARAEGVTAEYGPGVYSDAHRLAFADLWRSINGADSWDANPFVWRIGFRRVTP